MKTREKELLAKEAELNRREKVTGSNTETGIVGISLLVLMILWKWSLV
jgi:hypothetical protein